MNTLKTLLISIGITAGLVLFWCLFNIYNETTDTTKKLMQYCFWGIIIILFCCFMPVDVFEKAIEKGLYGGLATCIIVLLYWLFIILPISAKNKIKNSAKQAKLAPFKIEIVNDKKYTKATKEERIAFLHNLKKQTNAELLKKRKELENTNSKLEDIPDDVAKYIKNKDQPLLEKNISDLENKVTAIDELIESERK